MNWEWIIGGVLVLLCAHQRFNTRTDTTKPRFYFALFSYLLTQMFLFVLLGGGINIAFLEIFKAFVISGGDLPKVSSPLLSALILTALLPNFALLSWFDEWLKEFLQKMGRIAGQIGELSNKLFNTNYEIPSELLEVLGRNLRYFSEEDQTKRIDSVLSYPWTKVVVLYVQIQDWQESTKYKRFVENKKAQYEAIANTYERLKIRAFRVFTCSNTMQNVREDENIRRSVEECKKSFKDQADALLKQICLFVANGVMVCELSNRDRDFQLKKMGFMGVPSKRLFFSIDQILKIVIVLFVTMLGILVITSCFSSHYAVHKIHNALRISSMVSIIYGVSIIAAIHPKTLWDFADIQKVRYRPIKAYLLSGVLAVVMAFVVSLIFKFITFGDFLGAVKNIRYSYPWFGMSFVLAFIVAFLADDLVNGEAREIGWLHWLEGAIGGILLAGTSWIVRLMLYEVHEKHKTVIEQMPKVQQPALPELVHVLAISALIGAVVSFTIPRWYREMLREAKQEKEQQLVPH